MSARLIAFVCLSQFAICNRLPEPVLPPQPTLVVFLKGSDNQQLDVMRAMRQEIHNLMGYAAYQVEFLTAAESFPVSGRLVVMELKGQCSAENSSDVVAS